MFIFYSLATCLQVIDAVHSAVKELKVTQADVARGKKMAKAAIHMATESGGESPIHTPGCLASCLQI